MLESTCTHTHTSIVSVLSLSASLSPSQCVSLSPPPSQIKCFTLFVTHYPLLALLEYHYPQTVANFHMSHVETQGAGNALQLKQDLVPLWYYFVREGLELLCVCSSCDTLTAPAIIFDGLRQLLGCAFSCLSCSISSSCHWLS